MVQVHSERPRDEGRALDGVLGALTVTATGPDRFVAPSIDDGLSRIFGGQLLAQALIAAAGTVDRTVLAHSLHAHFLRSGDPAQSVEFAVSRVRDGRRLHTRTVTASQAGRALLTMTVSFADPADAARAEGPDHQGRAPVGPSPESLPTLAQWAEPWGGLSRAWVVADALDIRIVPKPPLGSSLVWQRVVGPLPCTAAVLHQALLVYLTDMTTLSAVLVPHGVPIGAQRYNGRCWSGVSIDHAVWFHRQVRADDWLLFAQESPAASAGRGLARADVFTRDGTLAASVAQQGMFSSRA
ncbi:acyl-CoA thioesterase [Streptomyces sp. NPDC020802]|uniref:acyl-CoA thioesterase n=1 Tax=Streptomyces sp. NPDC020802 TaxID=3365094 RepID=UPI003793F30F